MKWSQLNANLLLNHGFYEVFHIMKEGTSLNTLVIESLPVFSAPAPVSLRQNVVWKHMEAEARQALQVAERSR